MSGESQPRTLSKEFPISSTALEIIVLALLGAFAVVLRAKLRVPLQMPGHHGIEVMAVLLIGRRVAKLPLATTVSTLVAALFIWFPFMGMRDPFLPAVYILMGLTIDLFYKYFKEYKANFLFLGLLGGTAYMLIPLYRAIVQLAGWYAYPSLIREGYFYPVLSHFFFGAIGAFLAAAIVFAGQKARK